MNGIVELLDAMTGGIYAGAIVRSFREPSPLRARAAWLCGICAAAFVVDRWYFAGSVAAALVASLAALAVIVATLRERDAVAGILLVPLALAALVIVTGDAYDPGTQAALRAVPGMLLALPAVLVPSIAFADAVISRRRKT